MNAKVFTVVLSEPNEEMYQMYNMLDPVDEKFAAVLTEGWEKNNDGKKFEEFWIYSTAVINLDLFASCYDTYPNHCRLCTSDRDAYTIKANSLDILSMINKGV